MERVWRAESGDWLGRGRQENVERSRFRRRRAQQGRRAEEDERKGEQKRKRWGRGTLRHKVGEAARLRVPERQASLTPKRRCSEPPSQRGGQTEGDLIHRAAELFRQAERCEPGAAAEHGRKAGWRRACREGEQRSWAGRLDRRRIPPLARRRQVGAIEREGGYGRRAGCPRRSNRQMARPVPLKTSL